MRNAAYEGLFYELARTHQLIRHRDDSPRFARIIVSADPYQKQVDLQEMQETLLGRLLKPGAGQQVLVLESLQTAYRDNQGDNYQRQRRGAFYVLAQQRVKADAWHTLDLTEQTGEQLLGAVRHAWQDDPRCRLALGSVQADPIGPVGPDFTWYGTRFEFEFFTPATAALAYQPAVFSPAP